MSRIDRNHGMRHTFAAAALAVALGAIFAATTADARSITGVERIVSAGAMSLSVTFEAGSPGDSHALYIAYDTEDKGETITDWAELQRGCNVAADATSATIPVSPLLTGKGYKVCRVFLTTSVAPYDTLIESLRQSGTQYIDTGIKPDATSVAVMDTKFDSNNPTQQRFFGISSGNSAAAGLSFDCYINGSGKFASACKNGKGDWKEAGTFTTDRVRISLSAAEKHHVTITNLVTGAQIANKTYNTTCTATSVTNLHVFALYNVDSWSIPADRIAQGARLYSFTMSKSSGVVCDYKPCKLGDRVGVYDAVTDTVIYSASGTDFDAANSGSPVACSLLADEVQLAAAPSATGLFFDYTWRGTAENWGGTDAWEKDGANATWSDGNNAIFATANSAATLTDGVAANSIAFSADATVNGEGELSVKSVLVDSGVSATISAPISSALEKTGAGALTLTQNRTAATIVKEGMLKMDGATVADLTLGTDGGAPVALDYGGQELVKNTRDYLVTGSTVTLTNGTFSTPSSDDLNIRDDTFTMPSVLTIAKDAVVRQGAIGKSFYIVNVNGTATINVIGGTLGNTNGCKLAFLQHKSPAGGLNLNVSEGGLVYFPCLVYALCHGDIAVTSPSLYMTFVNSAFSVGTKFEFGSSWSKVSYVPTAPTGVFAATNSVVSVGEDFIVGRNEQDSKTAGSLTVDFENCVVTAKTFAVYYDRPLNNARFNGTRFVFGADSGSFAASDDAANWITVGDDGLTLDTQAYFATLNANLGGSGVVTKVGTGTLTVSRDQVTTGGICVNEGTLAVTRAMFAGPVAFAAGTTLNIVNYDGRTPLSADALAFPAEDEDTVALTMNGGAFGKGVYAICAAPGVSEAAGEKFSFTTADDLVGKWSVDGDTLLLTVGDISGDYWTGRGGDGKMSTAANWLNGVPEAGEDIDLSFVSSATTIIADTGRAFGTATMGEGVVTFTGELKVKGFSNTEKAEVGANSTVTIDNDVTLDDPERRLCKTIQAGGTLHITGSVNIKSSTIIYALRNAAQAGAIIVDGGIAVSGNGIVWWSSKVLALGEKGISFTDNAPFLFIVDDNEVYALGERTVLGTSGRGRFRSNHDDVFLCTTQYGSNRPATITFDGNFNGVSKSDSGSSVNSACWGHWRVTGCGKVVCTSAVKSNRGLRVYDGATLELNPNTATFGQDDQTFYVYNNDSGTAGGTLEVASSGTVTLTGGLSLADGAALGFNFTDWNTPPQLALSSGKTLTAKGVVNVKISGEVWPKGGEKILTTCGGFDAEGVTVSLAEGAPKWAKSVKVNEDGNIVLDVKPRGTRVIVR